MLNTNEQYSRLNNLRISGLTEQSYDKDGQQVLRGKGGKLIPVAQNEIKCNGEESTTPQEMVTNRNDEDNESEDVASKSDMSETLKRGVENKDDEKPPKALNENADQTTKLVLKMLNKTSPELKLKESDIDMCHHLGKPTGGRPWQVIIKFTSRLVRNKVYRLKKGIPKPLFVTEDLTKLTHQVFLSVKSKQPDEIARCWTTNGEIFFKNKVGNVHRVDHGDYDMWLDMSWPKANKKY